MITFESLLETMGLSLIVLIRMRMSVKTTNPADKACLNVVYVNKAFRGLDYISLADYIFARLSWKRQTTIF